MDNQEVEQLLALTGQAYDAALDAQLWPDVLKNACAYVGGSSANLFAQDIKSKRAAAVFQWGNDPHYEKLYEQKYYRLNPLASAIGLFEVGEVHSQSDVISYDEFSQTQFYQDWVRPQGIVDVIGATLERTDTRMAMLAVRQKETDGRVTDDTRRRMRLIVPHIRRAVAIGQVLEFHAGLATVLTDAINSLGTPVTLVDGRGRIVFSNASGRALLAEGAVARDVKGAFVASDVAAQHLLADAVLAAAKGDSAVGAKGVAVPIMAACGGRWIAHVLPLTSGARLSVGRRHAADAAIFLRGVSISAPSAMETVAKLYRLTPSEVRVLGAMVDIGGVPATARALGVSETTVKTHLQNLYEKTGVNRQAELVKLVAGTSSALSN